MNKQKLRETFERELGEDWEEDKDNRIVYKNSIEFFKNTKSIGELF